MADSVEVAALSASAIWIFFCAPFSEHTVCPAEPDDEKIMTNPGFVLFFYCDIFVVPFHGECLVSNILLLSSRAKQRLRMVCVLIFFERPCFRGFAVAK